MNIVELYKSGLSTYQISKILNINRSRVARCVKSSGCMRSLSESKRKYPLLDECILDNIDTEQKAYFLGLVISDGWNDKRFNQIGISLIEEDSYILETLSKLFYENRPLRRIKSKKPREKTKCRLVVISKKICDTMSKHGASPAKTHTATYPSHVPEHLAPHFIRGVFDGDGCISISRRKTKNGIRVVASFSIVGNIDLLKSIQKVIEKQCGIKPKKISIKHPGTNTDNIVYIRYSKMEDILRLEQWMYQDASVFLERKKNKFEELRNAMGRR